MALKLQYTYQGHTKTIGYANDKHHSMFEAAAAAEGLDLSRYRMLEQQVEMSTRDKQAHRDFRDNYFRELGFDEIKVIRDET
ncbi:DUF2960 domain-containing protein [Ferrimonas balearica]|uniref:DUF2960 domain-containing protein n=1 Tax=Ferrimonas balearica TaxID=44012 RepID=UPI001C9A25B8|nr:DUF2960 domain-containing protein [Ferrimonas balearica]MBY5992179.1 DUF2960 domain-containing protein [Ferrimonas balearica]